MSTEQEKSDVTIDADEATPVESTDDPVRAEGEEEPFQPEQAAGLESDDVELRAPDQPHGRARNAGRNMRENRADPAGVKLRTNFQNQAAQESARSHNTTDTETKTAAKRRRKQEREARRQFARGAPLTQPLVTGTLELTPREEVKRSAGIRYYTELVIVYAGKLICRHGVLVNASRDGASDLLPPAFWAHLSIQEVSTIDQLELGGRILKVRPAPLPEDVHTAIDKVFGSQIGFRPGVGMPLVSIIATGKAFKTTLLAHVWTSIPTCWYLPFTEPTLAAQGISIFYVVRVLRWCTLQGKLGLLDGLRAVLMIGGGGLRTSGLRTRSILDFAALSACVGNVIGTALPPTRLDAFEEIDRDLETASSVQISGGVETDKLVRIDNERRLIQAYYRIRGREAVTRSVEKERMLSVTFNETDWVIGQLLNLGAPSTAWSEQGLSLYHELYGAFEHLYFEGRRHDGSQSVMLNSPPSYIQRESFSYNKVRAVAQRLNQLKTEATS